MTQEQIESTSRSAVHEAIGSPDVPKMYANGFTIGLSNADSHVLFQLDGRPVVIMHMSYSLVKTLHQKLARMVSEFETKANRDILTTENVDEVFKDKAK